MSSSYWSSRFSSATHRRTAQTSDNPISPELHLQGLDPAPNPWPIFQFLSFGLIILLGFLQFFLPATHFRDPFDPLRNWLPFDSSSSSSTLRNSKSSGDENFSLTKTTDAQEDEMVHVVSWMECLDLRVLTVLTNSTLSSSRHPELVYFHFFIPEGNEDKVFFYKLKVLFPRSNLEIHGQEEVKAKIRTAVPGADYARLNFEEMAPFIIPNIHQSLSKFIYVSSNVIMKGRVEELIGVDLSTYAIAAAEDCSRRLNAYVNSDVLDAIQRSATKPWVSETPYAKDACMPALSVLLIDARKLEKNFVEAVLWWSKVLNWRERNTHKNPAIALALYNRYLMLSSSWLIKDSLSLEINKERMVFQYDGPKIGCSKFGTSLQSKHGNLWTQYLPQMSDQILGR